MIDVIGFPQAAHMNSSLVTTGIIPYTVGSVERFQLAPTLHGLPWALASATLLLTAPDGTGYSLAATVASGGYEIYRDWTVIGPVGTWVRAWQVVGLNAVLQTSRPITMEVITSPGTPF